MTDVGDGDKEYVLERSKLQYIVGQEGARGYYAPIVSDRIRRLPTVPTGWQKGPASNDRLLLLLFPLD